MPFGFGVLAHDKRLRRGMMNARRNRLKAGLGKQTIAVQFANMFASLYWQP
jgi:hypothetical protein